MTGAGIAVELDGSVSPATRLDDGRTASPFKIDQSFKLDSRYFVCSCVNWGGYFDIVSDAIECKERRKNVANPSDLLERRMLV